MGSTFAISIYFLESRHLISDSLASFNPTAQFCPSSPIKPHHPLEPLGFRSRRRGHKQTMMNALNSPVEPLALNYLSYGFFTAVNKMLAAWVAAVTAAFSFWRIGPSSTPRPEQRGLSKDAASTPCAPLLDRGLEGLAVADEPAKLVSTQGGTNCISSLETENSTKGKFVMYYRNDDFRDGVVEDDDGVVAESEKFRRWSGMDWERKMEIRMGNMGWYRCQDLAAFNGSVVRLWDGCSRVFATA